MSLDSLNTLTIKGARGLLDTKKISALDLTRACLRRIEEVDQKIKACLLVCESAALEEARQADKRLAAGEKGPLLGIPYLAKDILLTKGLNTTAASKILEDYIAPYDATVIEKLKAAGAILLGKTNLDEFAHGASTENSAYGPTKNPWDLSRVPGGSSGGSAAAVASDLCLFALGTDTGGSIRQPASFCNLVGLKPSYGRVSRFGLMAMTSSTDVIGPLTKTVADAALVLEVIAGDDDLDATTLKNSVENYSELLEGDMKGLKIGWPKEYFTKDLDKNILALMLSAKEELIKQGAEIIEISLPNTPYTVPVYYIITPSEISSNLARFDGVGWGLNHGQAEDLQSFYKQNRGQGFGPEVKRRIMLGTYALSAGYFEAYYKKALAVRTLIINDFAAAFKQVDLILTPTTPHPAFKLGEQVDDPLAMYLEDIYVTGASLSGLPALSLPAGFINKLPIGLQLIGPKLSEILVMRVANNLEKINNYYKLKANL
ncbi:MAG: Asp-tRNA(Asn)/Glu-tRNA(Gln) amidotransferase subunit GatA [Candidatus Falkowbacteria bacterium]|nr:Asp-tRNA(Asn)/Glu-tRNA(Gln) amidotransferase subunit GatA [Candidatus Falkowbacteria bacterium]